MQRTSMISNGLICLIDHARWRQLPLCPPTFCSVNRNFGTNGAVGPGMTCSVWDLEKEPLPWSDGCRLLKEKGNWAS